MSTSYKVFGIKPADDKWKKMKAIYDACVDANVLIPKEVDEFFDGNKPNDLGVRVELDKTDAFNIINSDGERQMVIDTTKISKDIQFVVFSISW